ncbi:MAG: hypothetical protein LBQ62_00965 [Candidatus Accumulibacter sp.]|jgi:hypothetical protein|nr:hypothetical protein [Accumulibacter sp.]
MTLFDEKRKSTDRRVKDDGPPPGYRERRVKKDRRQTEIAEISFHDWTLYLLKFKKRAAAKAAARQAAETTKVAARKALDPSRAVHGAPTAEHDPNAPPAIAVRKPVAGAPAVEREPDAPIVRRRPTPF